MCRMFGHSALNAVQCHSSISGRPYEDGEVAFKKYSYPIADAIAQIREMPIASVDQDALIGVLETGALPAANARKAQTAGI